MKKQKAHYINNAKFYEEMKKYSEQSDPKVISNYIGECFLLICRRLATRPNFNGYSYTDEMVEDAIENCIMAVNSFNPEKTNNPFAYFSTIAWYAFVRRIAQEKKQNAIKHKNLQNYFIEGKIDCIEDNELSNKVLEDFEEKL